MARFLTIEDATLVQGATSIGSFITAKINNTNIGLPVFTFTDPAMELFPATPGFDLTDSTFYDSATSYAAAVALTVNTSSFAIPVFKLPVQDEDINPNLRFHTPTMAGNLSSTGLYMVIANNNINYGVPVFKYSSYLNTKTNTLYDDPAGEVDTVIDVGKPTLDVTTDSGSTYLNPKLEAYSDIILRIKRLLGWPSINLDLCDESISDYVDTAI